MKTFATKRGITSFAVQALATSLGTLLLVQPVFAVPGYLTDFDNAYSGSTSNDNASCQLCHGSSTQNLNAYGAAICAQGGSISSRLAAVESQDSDNDPTGSNNLAEINASTQPGWTPGNVNALFDRGTCSAIGSTEAPPATIMGDLDPSAGNQPPVADANGPYSGTVNMPLTFDGTGSSDPDGTIVAYDWDFGDGNTGTDATPTHTYIADGTYNVSLTVTDDAGETGTDTSTATIGVGNLPPVADANGPYSGTVNMPLTFDGTGSSDPDGTIVAYDWDFGDGNTGTDATPTHTYIADGTYNVSLTVTDDAGAMDSAGTTATINAGSDVFLSKLQVPKSVKTSTARTVFKRITAVGDSVSVTQDATVNLNADVSGPVTVVVTPEVITDSVSAGNGSTRFKFSAEISCNGTGSGTVDWTAAINAAQNGDETNDTLTGATSVTCR